MTAENVDVLVTVILEREQVVIHTTSALDPFSPFIHAMSERQTIGQGSMHADYNGFNFWIRCRPLQNTFKPRNLCRSKLIVRCVIQRDEIN